MYSFSFDDAPASQDFHDASESPAYESAPSSSSKPRKKKNKDAPKTDSKIRSSRKRKLADRKATPKRNAKRPFSVFAGENESKPTKQPITPIVKSNPDPDTFITSVFGLPWPKIKSGPIRLLDEIDYYFPAKLPDNCNSRSPSISPGKKFARHLEKTMMYVIIIDWFHFQHFFAMKHIVTLYIM